MAAITVSAPNAVSEWVQRQIENGEYASASDYVLDLIRRDREALAPDLKVAEIRKTIEESRKRGPADEVFDRMEQKLRAMTD